ncbi:MAG: undecaprenyl-diphosphatase [Firmicutes bacterium]|nr:undecaprenyl-diphosphate phosphatase [Alicyclobacillaceae bacterium]MCL6497407.1 undecaprenyl-diphosphatase [Bacillota bacterium]
MSLLAAAGLGVLQGVAELFPFSSLGLLVLVPHLLGIPVPDGARYLPFLVALHVGTALALLSTLGREWGRLLRGWVQWLGGRHNPAGREAWLVVWATIPAGLLGLLLRHRLAALFGDPGWAARFLLVNALVMGTVDRISRRLGPRRDFAHLPVGRACFVGGCQALALIPGLSRTGLTVAAGVLSGLDYASAARFSFLLATPIIFAAGLVELPQLRHGAVASGMLPAAAVGGLCALVTAWLSARYLLQYFVRHRFGGLAWISAALGALGLLWGLASSAGGFWALLPR